LRKIEENCGKVRKIAVINFPSFDPNTAYDNEYNEEFNQGVRNKLKKMVFPEKLSRIRMTQLERRLTTQRDRRGERKNKVNSRNGKKYCTSHAVHQMVYSSDIQKHGPNCHPVLPLDIESPRTKHTIRVQ
jgi:hypothetical protein